MNAVERLEAAIKKLETLRYTTHTDWEVNEDEPQEILGMGFENATAIGEVRDERHAVLIVTLHRTIEAQLAILREELAHVTFAAPFRYNVPRGSVMDLADAILGGE